MLPFCPQSPSFLIRKKGPEKTLATLVQLHKPTSALEILAELEKELEGGKGEEIYTIPQLLSDEKLRKQLIVGVTLKIGVQFSGIDAIFYYSTLMFRHANVADPQASVISPF